MGRGKLNLKFIENEKARMTTYQKRKKGLKKKAEEFATLCGVPTCMVIYGPKLKNRSVEVDVWPKKASDFKKVVDLYRDKAFYSRGVKAYNLFDFFHDRKRKVDDKMNKLHKSNLESKFSSHWDDRLNSFRVDQLRVLLAKFDNNIEAAKRKIAMIKGADTHQVMINQRETEVDLELMMNINRQQPNKSSVMPQLPLDYHQMQYFQSLHRLPYDFNDPNYNNQMTMDGCDLNLAGQFGGSVSSGGNNQVMQQPTFYFDQPQPTTMIVDNHMMINNQRAMYFYDKPIQQQYYDQQPLPSNISSHMHGSHHHHHEFHDHHQFDDHFYGDTNEFGFKNEGSGNLMYRNRDIAKLDEHFYLPATFGGSI
ncbi:hypothetical protein Q3G72_028202 [Acer saccharum]|nr:hypothetical protein Q3G72_028202 [Acer saccharum]